MESKERVKEFYEIRRLVAKKFPKLSGIKWTFCAAADEEHRMKSRQYAHVFHLPNTICLAKAFIHLPAENKKGILLHEFGHLIYGNKGEDGNMEEIVADNLIRNYFGIEINYDNREVQTI